MKKSLVAVAILILLGGVLVGAVWYMRQHPAQRLALEAGVDKTLTVVGLRKQEAPVGLVASGFIEAEESVVTTDLGGRIVMLHADEGDQVAEGQVLVELDDSLLLAQLGIAKADLAAAEAGLAQIKAGVRQEALDHAQAILEQATVAQEAARIAAEDAQAMLHNPQQLELALTGAKTQAAVAGLQERQALAIANSAQAGRELLEESVQILEDFEPFNIHIGPYQIRIKRPAGVLPNLRYQRDVATYDAWQAWTGLEQAQAAHTGAADYLAELQSQQARPVSLQAQANAAESQYEVVSAAVALAQAQVEGLKMGATPEQIAAVAAQVEIARAALGALEVQSDKLDLKAPISGLVLERAVNVGELAMPGAPLMNLGDLDNLILTVYIPEDRLGEARVGQPVSVMVDAYPGRAFPGTVSYIASQAEFTPKNVQTREERVNLVFAVKVRLPNADHALKPGMPADAQLRTMGGMP